MQYSIRQSLIAGFTATLVLSIIMIVKNFMGLMSEMNPIADLVFILQEITGLSIMPVFAWLLHFFLGTVIWGNLFGLFLYTKLPGNKVIKGVVFGIVAWILMMLIVEPLAGHGIFGLQTSLVIPVISMMLHIVYGVILGVVYGKFSS